MWTSLRLPSYKFALRFASAYRLLDRTALIDFGCIQNGIVRCALDPFPSFIDRHPLASCQRSCVVLQPLYSEPSITGNFFRNRRSPRTMSSDEGGKSAAMPVTNGELHPATADTPSLPISGKRKRVSSPDEKPAQDDAPPTVPAEEKQELNQTLRYLLQIMAKLATYF